MLVIYELPKISLVITLIPNCLQDMIDKALEEREESYISKRITNMKVLPEFGGCLKKLKKYHVCHIKSNHS